VFARPDLTYGILAVLILLLIWWEPTEQVRRPAFLLIAGILLVAGVEVLRRLVLREHPDAGSIPPSELFRRRGSSSRGRAAELERLHEQGVLSDDELTAAKARLTP
jgi:hypothetical protein